MKKKFKNFLSNVIDILSRPEMTVLPGQLAYFFIVSLVPTLTLVYYFASFLHISLMDIASYFSISEESMLIELLTPAVDNSEFHFSIIVLLVVGIYIVSNGTNSIIVAANNIYGIKQKPFLTRRLKAIVMVFILILLFLFIALVPVFGNFILSFIEKVTGYNSFYGVISVLKLPLSWLVIFIFIKLLYMIAPDKHIPSTLVNKGAIFTSIGWVLSTQLYLYYAKHFAHYTLYYSGLSNIIILMIWMYILSTIFVIGLAINYKEEPYELERLQRTQNIKLSKKNHNKIDIDK